MADLHAQKVMQDVVMGYLIYGCYAAFIIYSVWLYRSGRMRVGASGSNLRAAERETRRKEREARQKERLAEKERLKAGDSEQGATMRHRVVWEEFFTGVVLLGGSIFAAYKGANVGLCAFFGIIGVAGLVWGTFHLFEK
jgi:hypothetical protein